MIYNCFFDEELRNTQIQSRWKVELSKPRCTEETEKEQWSALCLVNQALLLMLIICTSQYESSSNGKNKTLADKPKLSSYCTGSSTC